MLRPVRRTAPARFADLAAELAHQPVVDAVDGGTAAPLTGVSWRSCCSAGVLLSASVCCSSCCQRVSSRARLSSWMSSRLPGVKLPCALQVVADLLRARAEVVAAVAEQGQRIAVDGAIVGRPQTAVGGILDARVLRGRGPALPAAAGLSTSPPAADGSNADAQRDAVAGDGPADMAGAVGDQQVLRRHAQLRCEVQCRRHVGCVLQLHQVEVVAAWQVGDPRQRQRRAVDVLAHDRAPAGVLDGEDGVGPALDLDVLVVASRSWPSRRAPCNARDGPDRAAPAPSPASRRSCW